MVSPQLLAKVQTSDISHYNFCLCKLCPQLNIKVTKWQVGGMTDGGICVASNRGLILTCNLCPISFYRKGKRGSKTEFYSYSLLREKKNRFLYVSRVSSLRK